MQIFALSCDIMAKNTEILQVTKNLCSNKNPKIFYVTTNTKQMYFTLKMGFMTEISLLQYKSYNMLKERFSTFFLQNRHKKFI